MSKIPTFEKVIKYGFRDDTAIRVNYTIGQDEDERGRTFNFVELDTIQDHATGATLETTRAEDVWIEMTIESILDEESAASAVR